MNVRNTSDLILIGIGGGGCQLVENIAGSSDIPIRALRIDTDAGSRRESDKTPFLLFGGSRLSGHGAGGDVSKGRMAAQDDIATLASRLEGVKTAFVVTCLGGGTGTGATGEIVHSLHSQGLTVICLATKPFAFEGSYRNDTAQNALPALEAEVNSLLVMPMDDLYSAAQDANLPEATAKAGKKLCECVLLLWNILSKPGFITLNSEILHTLANNGGRCHASWAISGATSNRSGEILAALDADPLLRQGAAIAESHALLVGIAGGEDMKLAEIGELMKALNEAVKPGCNVEMGTIVDPALNGTLGMTVFAFSSWNVVDTAFLPDSKDAVPGIPPIRSDFPVTAAVNKKKKHRPGNTIGFGPTGLGQFDNIEASIYEGTNLDFPTYFRRNIVLEK